jgi:magnesium-transporting ATPase (P-type)
MGRAEACRSRRRAIGRRQWVRTRCQTTLKSRLALNATVRRDGGWKMIPAAEVVPGELLKLSLGGVVFVMLVGYAHFLNMPLAEIIPLVLTGVLASIPVALPPTFTLAARRGSKCSTG